MAVLGTMVSHHLGRSRTIDHNTYDTYDTYDTYGYIRYVRIRTNTYEYVRIRTDTYAIRTVIPEKIAKYENVRIVRIVRIRTYSVRNRLYPYVLNKDCILMALFLRSVPCQHP